MRKESPPKIREGFSDSPPEHLQGGHIEQINIIVIQAVNYSLQVVSHSAPPFWAAAHWDGLLCITLHLYFTDFDCRNLSKSITGRQEIFLPL